jgi:hypothetical protein
MWLASDATVCPDWTNAAVGILALVPYEQFDEFEQETIHDRKGA